MTNQIKFLAKLWFQMPIIFQPSSTSSDLLQPWPITWGGRTFHRCCWLICTPPCPPPPPDNRTTSIFITNRCHFVVLGQKAKVKESQEFRFGPNCWQISRRTWKTNYQSEQRGRKERGERERGTFCKVMKWWQSGQGVDSHPTVPRGPRTFSGSSSRAKKLLFVLPSDVNFFLLFLLPPLSAAALATATSSASPSSPASSSWNCTIINYTLGVWERKTIWTCSSPRRGDQTRPG